jgi:hypothetical protein
VGLRKPCALAAIADKPIGPAKFKQMRFALRVGAKLSQKFAQRQAFLELNSIHRHAEALAGCGLEDAVIIYSTFLRHRANQVWL